MAAYKAEFLAQRYAGRRRPGRALLAGLAAALAAPGQPDPQRRAARTAPRGSRSLAALAKRLGGIAPERDIPALADQSFQAWFARGPAGAFRARAVPARGCCCGPTPSPTTWSPASAAPPSPPWRRSATSVEVPAQPVCCGLTWISTGQLEHAKRVMTRTLATLQPWLDDGVPIVGLEPSCIRRPAAQQGAAHPAAGQRALVQVHCHQHADLGFDADREVMAALGVRAEVLDSGCCGLAGNFGFERGHYEVSQACGERVLFPAIRADRAAAVVADGYSCRTQIRQSTDGDPVHLAHLAAAVLAPADDYRGQGQVIDQVVRAPMKDL